MGGSRPKHVGRITGKIRQKMGAQKQETTLPQTKVQIERRARRAPYRLGLSGRERKVWKEYHNIVTIIIFLTYRRHIVYWGPDLSHADHVDVRARRVRCEVVHRLCICNRGGDLLSAKSHSPIVSQSTLDILGPRIVHRWQTLFVHFIYLHVYNFY